MEIRWRRAEDDDHLYKVAVVVTTAGPLVLQCRELQNTEEIGIKATPEDPFGFRLEQQPILSEWVDVEIE